MRIGYACQVYGLPDFQMKSSTLKNVTTKNLLTIINHNLNILDKILDYNIQKNILLFRISSDLIPFGSSFANQTNWQEIYKDKLNQISDKIKKAKMRLSMHPGQYTILNSPNKDVLEKSINDLKYHTLILDSLNLDESHKIILHIGGVYNEKTNAINRFITNYHNLDENIKKRLIIENDDKLYNINDVLNISKEINAPVVFDNLHNKLNPFNQDPDILLINKCFKTWKTQDGIPKIHYSQSHEIKKKGAHSKTINLDEFLTFYNQLDLDIDIMLEVKDKNLSALKCQNATKKQNIKHLESEWASYKYLVLEHSQKIYNEIRELLKNKDEYPAIKMYNLIDEALNIPIKKNNTINAINHVYGYFKDIATNKEITKYQNLLNKYNQNLIPLKTIKNYLLKLSKTYQMNYLLNSYYYKL